MSWPESTAEAEDEHARGDRLFAGVADPQTENPLAAALSYSAAAHYAPRSDDSGARLSLAGARAWRARSCDQAEVAQPRRRTRSKGDTGLRPRRRAQTRRSARPHRAKSCSRIPACRSGWGNLDRARGNRRYGRLRRTVQYRAERQITPRRRAG